MNCDLENSMVLPQYGERPASTVCARCNDNFLPLVPFAGGLACDPCIRAARCQFCKEAWAKGDCDACEPCTVKFYREHPEEFTEAMRDGLCSTEDGARIALAVIGANDKTAYELCLMAQSAIARKDMDLGELLTRAAVREQRRIA